MKTFKTILWVQLVLTFLIPVSSVYCQYYEQSQWVDFGFFGSHTGPLADPTVWDTSGCSWSFDDFRAAYYLGMGSPGEYIQLWFDWTSVPSLVGPCWLELYCGWGGICDTCWINIYLNDTLIVGSYGFFNGWDWQTIPHDFASQLHPGSASDDVKIEFVGGFGTCFEIIRMKVTDVIFSHDVGVLGIGSPPDTVFPETTYAVSAAVGNFGSFAEDFDVECTITPGGYVDTFWVSSMSPGSTTILFFMNWIVPPDVGTPYTVCVKTLLAGDENPSNDSLCKSVIAVAPPMHDVGVDSITSPPDTVEPGSVHCPAGLVKNFGNQIESFDAECQIDSSGVVIYVDTISVEGLMPDSTREGVFVPWAVPDAEGVTYRTCIWTLSPPDQVPENDTLCRTITVVTGAGEGLVVHAPVGLTLEQNRPNPFSRKTIISYEVPSECRVNLAVYDVTGRLIGTLVDGMVRAGQHMVAWNADNVEPGVYFCRLNPGGQTATRKMVVVE